MCLPGSAPNRLNLLRMRNSLWRPTTPELKPLSWDFAGGPVVRTPCFYHSGHRFHPWSGNWNPSRCSVEPKNKQASKQNSTTVHHHLNVPRDIVRQTTQGLVTIQGAELRGSGRELGLTTHPYNSSATGKCETKPWREMTFDTKKMPMLLQMAYRQGAFPLHFCLKFEWNHMLQNMSCACLCRWWRFLMICNSTFDDLNFLQWNYQKKSEM